MTRTLAWTDEQRRIIEAGGSARLLVEAGPGTGKTAVACGRIAELLGRGVTPENVLMISFTRAAVAEIRARIVQHAGPRAARIRVSTLDSDAWRLRYGFDLGPVDQLLEGQHDSGIDAAVALIEANPPELLDYLERLEHVVVDEAQDLLGARARLVMAVVRRLEPSCGVTVFADRAQAIYGFSLEEGDADGPTGAGKTMLDLIGRATPAFESVSLKQIHRATGELSFTFELARNTLLQTGATAGLRLDSLSTIARERAAALPLDQLPASPEEGTLVLFRRRAEVILESAQLADAGCCHRLRLSGIPRPVHPWIGWVLGTHQSPAIRRSEFRSLWEDLLLGHVMGDLDLEGAWELLSRFAPGETDDELDLARLRTLLSRPAPPPALASPECGVSGPILGTIHASKGREARRVLVVLAHGLPPDDVDEECRVLYVALTRATSEILHAEGRRIRAGSLDDGRTHSWTARGLQIEVGMEGDLELTSPVSSRLHRRPEDAIRNQLLLATRMAEPFRLDAQSDPSWGNVLRISPADGTGGEVADFRPQVSRLLVEAVTKAGRGKRLKRQPVDQLAGLYMLGARTVAVPPGDPRLDTMIEPYRTSGLFIAPVVRGFPVVVSRNKRRRRYASAD